ncbi:MAG: PEP-CTERM sorting domain-containing protein, partial [Pirellulales bacterium]
SLRQNQGESKQSHPYYPTPPFLSRALIAVYGLTKRTSRGNDLFGILWGRSSNEVKKHAILLAALTMSLAGSRGTEASDVTSVSSFQIASVPQRGVLLLTMTNPWPSGPEWTQGFGASITGVGNNVVVGVPYDDPTGHNDAGSLMVFDATTGAFRRKITNTYVSNDNNFGRTLATVGDRIVAGSDRDYSNGSGGWVEGGRAFVFNPAFGNTILAISSPHPAYSENFGNAVASFGADILVGAYHHTGGSNVTVFGTSYLLDGRTGALVREFPNPDPHSYDLFGQSVVAVGGDVPIGAPGFDAGQGANANSGRAYLFNGASGALLATLENPDPSAAAMFGSRVTAVGKNFAVSGGKSVYLFDGESFELIRTIEAESAQVPRVEWSLAGVGENLLVGNGAANAAYLFDGHTGDLLLTVNNPNPAYRWFGQSVGSLDGNLLVAANDAVFVFRSVPVPEPSTFLLFGIGAIGLIACRRWRRQAASHGPETASERRAISDERSE